jgi:hypothetical protein
MIIDARDSSSSRAAVQNHVPVVLQNSMPRTGLWRRHFHAAFYRLRKNALAPMTCSVSLNIRYALRFAASSLRKPVCFEWWMTDHAY